MPDIAAASTNVATPSNDDLFERMLAGVFSAAYAAFQLSNSTVYVLSVDFPDPRNTMTVRYSFQHTALGSISVIERVLLDGHSEQHNIWYRGILNAIPEFTGTRLAILGHPQGVERLYKFSPSI